MAKIELIIPGTTQSPQYSVVNDFLAPGYLSAVLRKNGHQVWVHDIHSLDTKETDLLAAIRQRMPDMVGFCLHSYDNVDSMRRLAERVRQEVPRCLIVCGGEHATYTAAWQLEQCSTLDGVLIGEGEQAILLLAEAALGKMSLETVPGIVARGGGARAPLGNIRCLDDIPWPDHDVIEQSCAQGLQTSLSVLTSRGCLGTCNFCNARTFMGTGQAVPFRRRSAEDVLDEIEHLIERYGEEPTISDVIGFQDVSFLDLVPESRKWLSTFISEVRRRRMFFNFFVHARANNIVRLRSYVEELATIGLVQVEVGLESGTQGQLDLFHKGLRLEDNLQAVHILRSLGISYGSSGFLMFHPYVRFSDLEANARFLGTIRHGLFDALSSRFQVLPGAAIVSTLEKDGKLLPEYHPEAVFAYRFEDARIAEFCSAANGVYEDVLQHIEMARYAGLKLAVTRSQLVRWGQWSSTLQSCGGEIEHAISDMVDVHTNAFLEMCTLCKEGSSGYQSVVNGLIGQSESAAQRVSRTFEALGIEVGMLRSEIIPLQDR